jgi:hypothetical protein
MQAPEKQEPALRRVLVERLLEKADPSPAARDDVTAKAIARGAIAP